MLMLLGLWKEETEHFCHPYLPPWELNNLCPNLPLCLFLKHLVFDRDILQLCFERYAVANHPEPPLDLTTGMAMHR